MTKKIRRILAYVLSFALIVASIGSWDDIGNVLADDYFDLGASENALLVQAAFVNSNSSNSWTYTGEAITPEVELWVNGELVDAEAYTTAYYNNIDITSKGAYVVITGNESYGYTGSYTKYFTIKEASLSNAVVNLESTTVAYAKYTDEDDFPIPNFTVTLDGETISSSYYTIFTSSISDTEKEIYVKGKGNYSGTSQSATYTITDANIEDQKISFSGYSFVYTGSEIKPTITIKDSYSGNTLVENTDYTLSYSGNTTGSSTEDTTITITITGINHYTGTVTEDYCIYYDEYTKKDIDLTTVTYSTSCTYTGKEIEGVVSKIKYSSTTLTEGTDYEVVYEDNIDVGTATVIIYGKGDYYGSTYRSFSIKAKSMSTDFISVTSDTLTYNNGSALSFASANVTVYDDDLGVELTLGTDYSLSYYDSSGASVAANAFTNAGDVTVRVTGTGNYTGSCDLTLIIEPLDITDSATMTLPNETLVYTGSAVTFNSDITVTSDGTTTLTKGADYELVYTNNNAAGTATVTAEFMGNYEGSVSKEFEIEGEFTDLTTASVTLEGDSFSYTGSAIEPEVTVEYDDETLTEGTHYSVSYSNNTDVGTATVTIKGINIGGYKGTITKEFEITARDISEGDITVENIADQEYNFGEEITPDITVYDENLEELTLDEDFNVSYSNNTEAGTALVTIKGIGNYESSTTTTFDILPLSLDNAKVVLDTTSADYTGYDIEVEIESLTTASGKEVPSSLLNTSIFNLDYSDNVNAGTCVVTVTSSNANYDGIAYASFEINKSSLENVSVSADSAEYNYGQDVDFGVIVTGVTGDDLVEGTDYEITNISNSTEVGTSTITISACDDSNYTGSYSVVTMIYALEITGNATIEFTDGDSYTWTGSAIEPELTVTSGGYTLSEGTDYTVTYNSNTDAGTADVDVEFTGNYSGAASGTFEITQRDITDCEASYSKTLVYTGDEVTPAITLTYDGYTLIEDYDYEVSYDNNISETDSAEINVTGINNLTGTATYTFSITTTKTDIESADITIEEIADQEYQGGDAVTPALTVKNGDVLLVEGTDYELDYNNNYELDSVATVTISGIGAYEGTTEKTFNIVAASLSGSDIDLSEYSFEYTGSEIEPEISSIVTAGGNYVKDEFISLFDITYSSNTNAGTAYVTITGDGTYYTGSETVKFTITAKDIDNATVTIDNVTWTGEALTPEIVISVDGVTLTEDDYTATYSNNTNVGTATVVIEGNGNYTGNVIAYFEIVSAPEEDILVTAITLNKNSTLLTVGDTENISATITPSDATNQNLSWTSDNTSVVTVDNGTITAISEGTATITVTTQDGSGIIATCTVTVESNSSSGGGSEDNSEEDSSKTDSSEGDSSEEGSSEEGSSETDSSEEGSSETGSSEEGSSEEGSSEEGSSEDASSEEGSSEEGSSEDASSEDASSEDNSEDNGSNTTEDNSEDNGSASTTTETSGSGSGYSGSGSSSSGSSSSGNNASTGNNSNNTTANNTDSKADAGTDTSTVAVGSTYAVDGCTYKVTKASTGSDGTVIFTKSSGSQATVKIPDTVTIEGKTYKVTSIAKNAFKGDTKLTTLVIGSNVKTIGASAFEGCTNLKTVTMGTNVTSIGNKAFKNCKKLTKITIPSKVKTIGKSAFMNCTSLKTLVIGKSVKKIGAKAFYNCTNLSKITIKSKKLKTSKVGKKAFAKTKATVKVKVPKAKKKAYKKMLHKRGISKKAKIS